MKAEVAKKTYQMSLKYFLAIVNDFEEKDANFAPTEGTMTVVQQIRHTALTVGWFWNAMHGKGFDMDFETFEKEVRKPSTLAEAISFLTDTYETCINGMDSMTDADLEELLEPNEIMGQVPKKSLISASADHSAHHRGSLVVYLRLTGKTPKMVYMD